jgi:hypothetical protein
MENYRILLRVPLLLVGSTFSLNLAWIFATPPANLGLVSIFAVLGVMSLFLLALDITGISED